MGKLLRGIALAAMLALPLTAYAQSLQPLVSVQWLHDNLDRKGLVIVDVRSEIDGTTRKEFQAGHIPGAVYSSYTGEGWRTEKNGVPGMLPSVHDLELLIGDLGISNDTEVVIVPAGESATDVGSATRVYWTFKVLGHDKVAVLNGGYKAWTEAGYPTEQGQNPPWRATFEADFREELIEDAKDVEQARTAGVQLVDNRPESHFLGREKHPAARAAGTIPGSLNLQEQQLTEDGTAFILDREKLNALMQQASVKDSETITFCNTGHWASLGWFALSEIAGNQNVAMYDGSMTDWTQDEARPLQTERRGLGGLIDWLFN